MPTISLYAVRDAKQSVFGPPVPFVNDAVAVRSFHDVCNDPASDFFLHPEDYSFHCVGSYDQQSGSLLPEVNPRFVCNAPIVKKS